MIVPSINVALSQDKFMVDCTRSKTCRPFMLWVCRKLQGVRGESQGIHRASAARASK